MIFDPPGNKMLATRLDCLIGSELSEPSRAELTLTERISCSVRGFPSQAELRACSVRLGSLPSLIEDVINRVPSECKTHWSGELELFKAGEYEIGRMLSSKLHEREDLIRAFWYIYNVFKYVFISSGVS